MRILNTLRISVGALAIVAVLVGASSAEATTSFCKENTSPCPAAKQYPAGTEFAGMTASGAKALLTTEKLGTVECESSFSGSPSEGSSTEFQLVGSISTLGWSSCTLKSNPCTVTSVNLPYRSITVFSSMGKGIFEVDTASSLHPGAAVKCGAVIECTYTTASFAAHMTIVGGAAGSAFIEANSVSLARSNETSKCPRATWDAKYFLQRPTAGVWVEE